MFNEFFIEFHKRLDYICESEDIIKSNDFDDYIDFKKEFIIEHNLIDNDNLIIFILNSFFWWFYLYY